MDFNHLQAPVTYHEDAERLERYEAEAAWYLHNAVDRVTPEASALYDLTLAELLADGEVSEKTSFLWDDLKDRTEAVSVGRAA
jgi:hypothetical protein